MQANGEQERQCKTCLRNVQMPHQAPSTFTEPFLPVTHLAVFLACVTFISHVAHSSPSVQGRRREVGSPPLPGLLEVELEMNANPSDSRLCVFLTVSVSRRSAKRFETSGKDAPLVQTQLPDVHSN